MQGARLIDDLVAGKVAHLQADTAPVIQLAKTQTTKTSATAIRAQPAKTDRAAESTKAAVNARAQQQGTVGQKTIVGKAFDKPVFNRQLNGITRRCFIQTHPDLGKRFLGQRFQLALLLTSRLL